MVSGNRLTTTYGDGESRVDGGGIMLIQSNALALAPVAITGNYLFNGAIQVQTNARNISVVGNILVTETDYGGTHNAAIVLRQAVQTTVTGNVIKNLSAAPSVAATERYGVYVASSSGSSLIAKNTIEWPVSSTYSTATFDDGFAATVVVDGNTVLNASTPRHVGAAMVRHHYETGPSRAP